MFSRGPDSVSGTMATFILLLSRGEPFSPVDKTSQLLDFDDYPPKVERIKCTAGRGRADRVSARPCLFFEMKNNLARQHEAAFAIFRASLSHLNLPMDLVDELIERHIPVAFEKGESALGEGNTDGMLACILSGYVNVCCSLGDGNRTLVRMAGPGEVIGYPDYIDEKGRQARLFEAQVASKCTLALFSREHVATLLTGLPGCTDFNPDLPEHFLVGESPALYRHAEPSLLGSAHDRDERSGEAGRGKRLGRDNPDS